MDFASDRLKTPRVLAIVGWLVIVAAIIAAARIPEDGELGTGLVFVWILGWGCISGGIILLSAVALARQARRKAPRSKALDNVLFGAALITGIMATLYGAAWVLF
jgi:hypothetical protein